MKNPSDEDRMREALALAEDGRFAASPNPMVGALVIRHGRVVGRGSHRHYGGDHAEVLALKEAGSRARGATLYVTLEPCSTWGKTPPCVQAIFKAGIRKVVVGSPDPNPLHHRKGIRELRARGIEVLSGILAPEVRAQNAFFFKYVREKIPYVTLKMAQTWDGKIATQTGMSRWVSSFKARQFVHRLRAEQDAILVGTHTVLADNPNLLPRGRFRTRAGKPWRVILDPRLEVPAGANVFRGPSVTLRVFSQKKQARFSQGKTHSRIIGLPVPQKKDGRLDLAYLLKKLGKMGVAKLLVEGGGETAWSFLENRLVDRLLWIMAPKIFGGRDAKTSVEGEGVRRPSEAFACRVIRSGRLGPDWLFEAEVG